MTVEGNHRLTTEITRHEHLRSLELVGNHELIDLTPLIGCRQLKHLDLVECPAVKSLSPLTTTKVELLSLGRLMDGLSLGPLAGHTTLRRLYLACRPVRRTAEIPVGPQLTGLTLFGDARSITLDDLGQWPGLSRLGITGGAQAAALAQQKTPPSLTDLHLHLHPALDPRTLVHHQGVRELMLLGCTLSGSLAPLAEMRALTNLTLNACYAAETVAVDLTPLAPLERLTITVRNGTPVRGADLFPPERLVIE